MDIATPHAPMQVLASYKARFSNVSAALVLVCSLLVFKTSLGLGHLEALVQGGSSG